MEYTFSIMVKTIQSASEIPSNGLVVLDFFADWCGPCQRIAPSFAKLTDEFPSVSFLKVNVDESEELSNSFSISALPTFVFLKDGRVIHTVEGANLKEVVNKLTELS